MLFCIISVSTVFSFYYAFYKLLPCTAVNLKKKVDSKLLMLEIHFHCVKYNTLAIITGRSFDVRIGTLDTRNLRSPNADFL